MSWRSVFIVQKAKHNKTYTYEFGIDVIVTTRKIKLTCYLYCTVNIINVDPPKKQQQNCWGFFPLIPLFYIKQTKKNTLRYSIHYMYPKMDPIKTTSCSTKYKATLKEKCKIGNTRRGP